MKHILFLLVFALLVPAVQAAPNAPVQAMSRRQIMVQRYSPKAQTEEQFLEAVRRGDTGVIFSSMQESFLKATDKFGNNCFHLAKDAATVQALAAGIRRLKSKDAFPEDYLSFINYLRNQRNNMGEIPLMTHINYGKADTFQLLYTGTKLAAAIRAARSVDKGGALSATADIKKNVAIALSTDNSGRTVAQAALANREAPEMEKVIAFFEENASYLF